LSALRPDLEEGSIDLTRQSATPIRLPTRVRAAFLVLPVAIASTLAIAPGVAHASVTTPSANLVISEVFGGGGGNNSYYANDFVVVFNAGSSPESLKGLSLQYATDNGAISASNMTVLPDVSLQPGQHFLLAAQNAGAGKQMPLVPPPDLTVSSVIEGDSGTVFLVDNTTALTSATSAPIIDEVGFGNGTGDGTKATDFLGSPIPDLSQTTGAVRDDNGCTNTNDNAADFTIENASLTAPAMPILDLASPATPCTATTTPPAATPEAPLTIELPVAGLGAIAGVIAYRRRRAAKRRSTLG
jgi:Lamin Tail Domain